MRANATPPRLEIVSSNMFCHASAWAPQACALRIEQLRSYSTPRKARRPRHDQTGVTRGRRYLMDGMRIHKTVVVRPIRQQRLTACDEPTTTPQPTPRTRPREPDTLQSCNLGNTHPKSGPDKLNCGWRQTPLTIARISMRHHEARPPSATHKHYRAVRASPLAEMYCRNVLTSSFFRFIMACKRAGSEGKQRS